MADHERMTVGAYCARLGISDVALRKAAVKHGLPWQPGDRFVPVAEMDEAWSALYEDGLVKTPPPGYDPTEGAVPGSPSYERERTRKTKADADIAEMKLAKLRGELVPVTEVEAALTRQTAALAAAWDALPAKLAPLLPGDRRETIRIVRSTLDDARAALREQIIADVEAEERAAESDDEDEEALEPPKKVTRARRSR